VVSLAPEPARSSTPAVGHHRPDLPIGPTPWTPDARWRRPWD